MKEKLQLAFNPTEVKFVAKTLKCFVEAENEIFKRLRDFFVFVVVVVIIIFVCKSCYFFKRILEYVFHLYLKAAASVAKIYFFL